MSDPQLTGALVIAAVVALALAAQAVSYYLGARCPNCGSRNTDRAEPDDDRKMRCFKCLNCWIRAAKG